MSKQVYISADYSEYDGDRDVVEELNKWGSDNLHKVDFIDIHIVWHFFYYRFQLMVLQCC